MKSTEVFVIDSSSNFRTTTFEAEKPGLSKRKTSVASITTLVRELGTRIGSFLFPRRDWTQKVTILLTIVSYSVFSGVFGSEYAYFCYAVTLSLFVIGIIPGLTLLLMEKELGNTVGTSSYNTVYFVV